MMWETLGTVRDLGRLQEIAVVLIRYGFGDVVRRIGRPPRWSGQGACCTGTRTARNCCG